MASCGIIFLLIQIDEAHSSAWPAGLVQQPEPQKNIEERLHRANQFVQDNPLVQDSPTFTVHCDDWSNSFGETYRAWPDKYYCFDSNLQVIAKSVYGDSGDEDAMITKDCTKLIEELLER
jgi:hypothetical protein